MIERLTNGKTGRWWKALPAVVAAVILFTLTVFMPMKVLAAQVQSYTISIEALQERESEEIPEYGAANTADESTDAAIWLAVLLFGTGWILDRMYLRNREDKHDWRKETRRRTI